MDIRYVKYQRLNRAWPVKIVKVTRCEVGYAWKMSNNNNRKTWLYQKPSNDLTKEQNVKAILRKARNVIKRKEYTSFCEANSIFSIRFFRKFLIRRADLERFLHPWHVPVTITDCIKMASDWIFLAECFVCSRSPNNHMENEIVVITEETVAHFSGFYFIYSIWFLRVRRVVKLRI